MFKLQNAVVRRLALVGTLMVATGAVGAEIDLEMALRAHETTIDSLNSFEMRVEVRAPSVGMMRNLVAIATGTGGEPVLWHRHRWLVDGRNERVQSTPFEITSRNGLVMDIDDIVRDGTVEKVLSNWDWNNPQKISPANQGSVLALARPQTDSFRNRDPAQLALLYPRFELTEPRMRLGRFVKRFRDKSCTEDGVDVVIELRGDALGFYKDDERVRVVLSKPSGFLIRSMVREKIKPQLASDYGKEWNRMQYEVTKFQSVAAGIPFPESVRYSIFDAFKNVEVMYSINTFSCVSANEAIGQSAFKLDFPKDVLLTDSVEDPRAAKWYLIGENGTRIPILSKSDLLLYDNSVKRGSRKQWWLLANAGVFLVVLIFLGRRAWRRR